MRFNARTALMLAVVGLLAVACTTGGGAAPVTSAPSAAAAQSATPAPTPYPTPKEVTPAPPTLRPMTDGQGDEYVTGFITSAVLATPYVRSSVDKAPVTEEIRGGVLALTFDMNDPRVTGVGHMPFSIDVYSKVGTEWGVMELTTEQGSWSGPCTGGSWSEGNGLIMSCWLAGAGDFKGWTYYVTLTGPSNGNGAVEGVVYQGVPPTIK